MDQTGIEEALATLGEVLQRRGERFEVVAIGGGALLLLGLIGRPTKDIDIVGLVEAGIIGPAQPLPSALREAVVDVASALGLADDWLNGGPSSLLDFGLPSGFASRVERRTFGALTVNLAGRADQVCFKFYAAVDQGPRSKHVQDLKQLAPTDAELEAAAAWAQTHDVSAGFRLMCDQVLRAFGVAIDD